MVIRNKVGSRKEETIDLLYKKVSDYLSSARWNVLKAVNTQMLETYWLIGRDIVEEEQKGKSKANYGSYLINEISARLTKEFGKGYSVTTLKNIRQFYLTYPDYDPISSAPRSQFNSNLSWAHYRMLMRVSRPEARKFYELETSKNNWSSRELERQIGSLLFDRLAKSRVIETRTTGTRSHYSCGCHKRSCCSGIFRYS